MGEASSCRRISTLLGGGGDPKRGTRSSTSAQLAHRVNAPPSRLQTTLYGVLSSRSHLRKCKYITNGHICRISGSLCKILPKILIMVIFFCYLLSFLSVPTCHLPFVLRLVADILATAGAPGVSRCIEALLTVRVPGRRIVAWERGSRSGYPGVWVCAACDCTGEVPGRQGKGSVMLSVRLGTTCFDA